MKKSWAKAVMMGLFGGLLSFLNSLLSTTLPYCKLDLSLFEALYIISIFINGLIVFVAVGYKSTKTQFALLRFFSLLTAYSLCFISGAAGLFYRALEANSGVTAGNVSGLIQLVYMILMLVFGFLTVLITAIIRRMHSRARDV